MLRDEAAHGVHGGSNSGLKQVWARFSGLERVRPELRPTRALPGPLSRYLEALFEVIGRAGGASVRFCFSLFHFAWMCLFFFRLYGEHGFKSFLWVEAVVRMVSSDEWPSALLQPRRAPHLLHLLPSSTWRPLLNVPRLAQASASLCASIASHGDHPFARELHCELTSPSCLERLAASATPPWSSSDAARRVPLCYDRALRAGFPEGSQALGVSPRLL